jgi:hypothetical protein
VLRDDDAFRRGRSGVVLLADEAARLRRRLVLLTATIELEQRLLASAN